jgi:hypothetical protein
MRLTAFVLICSTLGCAAAQSPRERAEGETYAPAPPSILTPNQARTRVGTLKFFDGLPDAETVDTVYEHLDFMRAVRAYLQAIPGASMMAMRAGMEDAGMLPNYSVLIGESMMDSKSLLLSADTETVYALAWISLKGGPIVVETPPRALGLLSDAWQQPLAETGKAGPDRGRGGRYVIVPPQYSGYVPRSQFAVESPTFGVWAVFRGALSKGSPKRAIDSFKTQLKIYPLKESTHPPPNVFIDVSGKFFNTIQPSDLSFFERIDELVQEEPNEAQDPELLGILASIGIEKGQRFAPDERMQAILREAAAVGNATARALLFAPRDPEAALYADRQWQRLLLGGSHTFVRNGVELSDARARYYGYAAGVTPTMTAPKAGSGTEATATFRDSRGLPLDGSRTYALTLPPEVPAAYFWSVTVYDNQTRSMLQSDQRFPSIISGRRNLRRNRDGSTTLRFGPNEPKDRKLRANWIQTVPGKGWNAAFRLYGPQQAWFEQTWRPSDIELVTDVPRAKPSKKAPKMRTEIPQSVLTPELVQTRIGTLQFVDGFPTDETVKRVYEHLDFIRGVDAFLTTLSGASLVSMRRGLRDAGVDANDVVGIFEGLMDSHSLFLTPNTESIYFGTWLDLGDGAVVVESPPNTLGVLDDFFFRYVADLGNAGPDQGKGGLYLFVPPQYRGQISERYFNYASRTRGNLLMWRGFVENADPAPAVQEIKRALKIYPLEFEIGDEEIDLTEQGSTDADQAEVEDAEDEVRFVSMTGKPMNTIPSNDFGFYQDIHELVQEEPAEALSPQLLGLLASIGIEKTQPFAPDQRRRAILSDAVAVANATARAIAFRPRDASAYRYEGSSWYTPFVGNSYRYERRGVRLLDARTMFFYLATMMTPAMVVTKVGAGSQYALAATDSQGRYLDGGSSYQLLLPKDIPAKNFWSVVVYDPQTRSLLQTPRSTRPSLNSQSGSVATNPDGSTTIYFGPEAPAGKESNWIQTVPGKGWFTILRLYGPLEQWFTGTWRPGEIEQAQ